MKEKFPDLEQEVKNEIIELLEGWREKISKEKEEAFMRVIERSKDIKIEEDSDFAFDGGVRLQPRVSSLGFTPLKILPFLLWFAGLGILKKGREPTDSKGAPETDGGEESSKCQKQSSLLDFRERLDFQERIGDLIQYLHIHGVESYFVVYEDGGAGCGVKFGQITYVALRAP